MKRGIYLFPCFAQDEKLNSSIIPLILSQQVI